MSAPILATCLAVLLLSCPAFAAMKGEPREVFGIPFGREYAPDASFACQSDSEEGLRCTRGADEKRFAGVPLASLTYLFMYRYLYMVEMEVAGRDAFARLVREMTMRHGEPKKLSGGMLSLEGAQVDILMVFDHERGMGEVSYVFKNLPCPVE